MKWSRVCGFMLIFALLSGCAGSVAWRSMRLSSTAGEAEDNNAKLMNLSLGQSRAEVLEIMGPPAKREAYALEAGRSIEFLFYRTGGWSMDTMRDTDAQFTPVAFEGDQLVGWGRNFYDRVIRSAVDVRLR